jgi:hypothetical protein
MVGISVVGPRLRILVAAGIFKIFGVVLLLLVIFLVSERAFISDLEQYIDSW